jgi:hypothetical protein
VEPATLLVEEPLVVVVTVSENGDGEKLAALAALSGEFPGDGVEPPAMKGFG